MFKKGKMTTAKFLKSLKTVAWRIKKDNQWYELRVANSELDWPFIDKEGELFGLKNSKINFFIFKAGTDEPADWAPEYLYDNLAGSVSQEDPACKAWTDPVSTTMAHYFVHYLLDQGGFVIYDEYGEKEKPWPKDVVF